MYVCMFQNLRHKGLKPNPSTPTLPLWLIPSYGRKTFLLDLTQDVGGCGWVWWGSGEGLGDLYKHRGSTGKESEAVKPALMVDALTTAEGNQCPLLFVFVRLSRPWTCEQLFLFATHSIHINVGLNWLHLTFFVLVAVSRRGGTAVGPWVTDIL